MFEPLGTKLLGRRVGRHTRWADTCVLGRHASTLFDLDFGVWILDFSCFFLAFWDVMGNPMNGTEKRKK